MVQASGMAQNAATSDPNDPRNWPPIFLTPAPGTPGAPQGATPGTAQPGVQAIPGQPGQQIPGQPYAGQYGGQPYGGQQYPGQQYSGQNATGGVPGSFQPGLPGQLQVPGQTSMFPVQTPPSTGQTNPINPNQLTAFGPGQSFNPQGAGTVPAIPGGASNPAVGMINDMLRQPSQAGSGSAFNNTLAAGGLAGVASNFKGPSIKVYKDRQKYNEWEFIFDLKQGLPGQQQQGAQTGQGLAPAGQGPTGSTFAPTPTTTPTTGTSTPPPTPPNQP